MHFVDHVFVILLFVVQPICGAWAFRRYLRKIEAGEPADRIKLYRETSVIEWLALAVLATAWYLLGRPIADLGFVPPDGIGFFAGIGLLILVSGLLAYSWLSAKTMSVKEKAKHVEALGDLVHFLPRNERDYRSFFALSMTAGVVEEIIYRGFVIWYLVQFMPNWGAVIVSSVFFGLGHSYQGAAGMLRTGLAGLGFGVFYLFTGSIWLPIIGHALFDILQGRAIVEVLRQHSERPQQGQPTQAS